MSRQGREDGRQPTVSDSRATSLTDRAEPFVGRTTLPIGAERSPVIHRERTYHLRHSDVRILATVGAFRIVPLRDLGQTGAAGRRVEELRDLREQGLIDVKTVTVNGEAMRVAVLTRVAKSLLAAHQDRSDLERSQRFYAGLVKPREVAHDAQLLRLFETEAARIEQGGGRIERVVLDYELKSDYQTFLNRPNRSEGPHDDVAAFAAAHDLPVIDGHLELPDLRIEYEDPDGSLHHRDVELVTEHYSRAQLAGKQRAGFAMYRAAGGHRLGGASSRRGGTPVDPHHMERLV